MIDLNSLKKNKQQQQKSLHILLEELTALWQPFLMLLK